MHQCAHHDHSTQDYGWAFALGVGLNLVFVAVEAGFGIWSNSLALLADAGHNLSDVLGLLLAWGAYALAKVAPSANRTYGWRGSTILAALFNALLLLVAHGCGDVNDNHRLLAAVLEMIHTATLVHDDVLDGAEVRRHHETINQRAGNAASVLLGDFLFSHAFYLASSVGSTST